MAVIEKSDKPPLFFFMDAFVKGSPPDRFEVLTEAEVSIFETIAKVKIHFKAMPSNIQFVLRGGECHAKFVAPCPELSRKIVRFAQTTEEQYKACTIWDNVLQAYQFPKVTKIEYEGFLQNGLVLQKADGKHIFYVIEKWMAFYFPSKVTETFP